MTHKPAQTEIDENTEDALDHNNQVNDENDDEERLQLLESRVLECEQVCGIPEESAPRCEKTMTTIVFQVHHKLLIFGTSHALLVALIILAVNAAFVIGFTIHEMRSTCKPTLSLTDGDLPDYAYQITYRDSGNNFLCTTSSFNGDDTRPAETNTTTDSECDFWNRWTPCTLRGLTSSDYNLNENLCPVSYNGCYRSPICDVNSNNETSNTNGTGLVDISRNGGLVNVCDSASGSKSAEITCQGLVSISYYSCPSAGTVIGAALGYTALIQMAALVVVVTLYLLIRALMGRALGWNDMLTAMGSPGTTADEVKSSRQQQEMELAKRDHNGSNGDRDESEKRKEDGNEKVYRGFKLWRRITFLQSPETA